MKTKAAFSLMKVGVPTANGNVFSAEVIERCMAKLVGSPVVEARASHGVAFPIRSIGRVETVVFENGELTAALLFDSEPDYMDYMVGGRIETAAGTVVDARFDCVVALPKQ